MLPGAAHSPHLVYPLYVWLTRPGDIDTVGSAIQSDGRPVIGPPSPGQALLVDLTLERSTFSERQIHHAVLEHRWARRLLVEQLAFSMGPARRSSNKTRCSSHIKSPISNPNTLSADSCAAAIIALPIPRPCNPFFTTAPSTPAAAIIRSRTRAFLPTISTFPTRAGPSHARRCQSGCDQTVSSPS